MNYKILKKFRVAVALIFFILTGLLFVDFTNTFSHNFSGILLWPQFVPSLLKFINVAGFAALGFLFVILLTLMFGRVYCSAICPFGILQDILLRISNRKKKKWEFRYKKPLNILRYSILGITVLVFISGSILAIDLLDPYSNFGKITSNIFRPVIILINNLFAGILEKADIYLLYPVSLKNLSIPAIVFSFLLLFCIVWMTLKRGRLFCNSICPVGALLGILSKYSLYKIKIDESVCSNCGLCSLKCKAECIDTKNKTIDYSRCVGCFNCLTACRSNGIKLEFLPISGKNLKQKNKISKNRRYLIGGMLSGFLALPGITSLAQNRKGRGLGRKRSSNEIKKTTPVTPPGAISVEHFTQYCTACHLCVSACPTNVLVPAFTEYGLKGFLQPVMNFKNSYCNYDCIVCSEICPTGAILPLTADKKKETQIGISHFVRRNCIVITDKTDCGACSEHCPTKAVDMVLHRNGLYIPKVTPEICIGCGACEYVCPANPKAIYVDGNPFHNKAEKPSIETIAKNIYDNDDFPF